MLCRIFIVQIQRRKHVLDNTDYAAPIRQHELDHTDHTDEDYIYPAWQMYVMNCSAVVLHFCTGNRWSVQGVYHYSSAPIPRRNIGRWLLWMLFIPTMVNSSEQRFLSPFFCFCSRAAIPGKHSDKKYPPPLSSHSDFGINSYPRDLE